MKTMFLPQKKQAIGSFAGGAIREFKPIGFPQDGGLLTPYSTLFYWAYAFSDGGGLIGEHPHKGFEIFTYVIEGEIEHYDSLLRGWKQLSGGDAQIIRAGSGVTHAERIGAGGKLFQIWFDPDLSQTLSEPASYNDFSVTSFPVKKGNGVNEKVIIGEGSPVKMRSAATVRELHIVADEHAFPIAEKSVWSVFVLDGEIEVGDIHANKGDFMIVSDCEEWNIRAKKDSVLFVIESPVEPEYALYHELFRRH